eukprot:8819759-Alexandrium_andersonii.AAC.1
MPLRRAPGGYDEEKAKAWQDVQGGACAAARALPGAFRPYSSRGREHGRLDSVFEKVPDLETAALEVVGPETLAAHDCDVEARGSAVAQALGATDAGPVCWRGVFRKRAGLLADWHRAA